MGISSSQLLVLAVVVVVGAVALGYIEMPTFEAGGPLGPSTPACGFASATFTADARNKYDLSGTDLVWQVYDGNGIDKFNTTGTGRITLSSSAPTALSGFIMMGNDNHHRTIGDQGTEYYMHRQNFAYGPCEGRVDLVAQDIYPEDTGTWTGYDNGAVEATTNITVGSGATVKLLELKLATTNDKCIGNPEIPQSFAVCFNSSNTGLWDEVSPSSYASKVSAPDFMDNYNIVNDDCYVISDAICDNEEWRDTIVLDAAASQNPGTADYITAMILDKTYYLDDSLSWQVGWGMDSDITTDTDVGIVSVLGNTKTIYLA
jgi:hypothetical protein